MSHIQSKISNTIQSIFDPQMIKKGFNLAVGVSLVIALIEGCFWAIKSIGSLYGCGKASPFILAAEKIMLIALPTASLGVFLTVLGGKTIKPE